MSPRQQVRNNLLLRGVFVVVATLSLILALAYFKRTGQAPLEQEAANPAAGSNSASPQAPAATAEPVVHPPRVEFEQVIGRWLREDGGYVLEIRQVHDDGTMEAAYFNPSPIHVSKAAVAEEGGSVKVGIELRDVNYPGCLYMLVMDSELDQLQGTYFQAALRQTFPVRFIRMGDQEGMR